jgi:hypothetical protein
VISLKKAWGYCHAVIDRNYLTRIKLGDLYRDLVVGGAKVYPDSPETSNPGLNLRLRLSCVTEVEIVPTLTEEILNNQHDTALFQIQDYLRATFYLSALVITSISTQLI